MPPPKGKQGTKGQKQILEENRQTINFYTYMGTGATVFSVIINIMFYWDSFSTSTLFMLLLCASVYGGSVHFFRYMAKASFSETGQLLDGGLDLNMESGVAEHVKDLVILTSITQVLALISSYFWLMFLLAPIAGGYLLWTNLLGPWFFQAAPEVDEKKQKKMERKMRRH